ncbi:MBL fold metallo-hydrolase [Maribacter halichondriae]|uniref:MBL fold metallo-hydrolase n=1 Tax=Maribacter halichondriae TaxID=2980554 RepID=UPI002358957E|nr:MBL fold metallo-hydrolase [Maribacter sp. Hal144]
MKKYSIFIFSLATSFFSCGQASENNGKSHSNTTTTSKVALVILGTAQDAGSPHIACEKTCCANLFENPDYNRKVVSLGIIDSEAKKTFLFEATPDMTEQLKTLKKSALWNATEIPNGIFLTHAHIGHYTGLMYLGKEATNADKVPVYVMPKMKSFLEKNGPWSQLVSNKNIDIKSLEDGREINLTPQIKVIPFTVPHRDEYSETVGYKIIGPNRSVLFIPDIDKWQKWSASIVSEIEKVDFAFLDATFYDAAEINNRDISEIPHPFVIESIELFENLPTSEKKKIHFIHFNHTNPLLNSESEQSKEVLEKGFNIARTFQKIQL